MDSGKLSFEQMRVLRDQAKRANEEKRLEACRRRLDSIISKKIRTTFIGAIAKVEESLGFLWGHGKNEADLTPDEAEMAAVWNQVRTDILNIGNNQLRGAQTEIAQHVVSWNRYQTNFVIKTEDNDG
jgi:hypothetical protein